MLSLYTRVQTLWLTRDRGASAVEYGLMVAAIAAVIVVVVFLFGGAVRDVFRNTCNAITPAACGVAPSPAS